MKSWVRPLGNRRTVWRSQTFCRSVCPIGLAKLSYCYVSYMIYQYGLPIHSRSEELVSRRKSRFRRRYPLTHHDK